MSGISALFVGGPMNGRQEQLARPFPTHSFRMYLPNAKRNAHYFLTDAWPASPTRPKVVDTHCVELTYVLDLKNFEPYVYVLKGLKGDALDQAYRDALMCVKEVGTGGRTTSEWAGFAVSGRRQFHGGSAARSWDPAPAARMSPRCYRGLTEF